MEKKTVMEGNFESIRERFKTVQESRKIRIPKIGKKINFKNLIKFFCF